MREFYRRAMEKLDKLDGEQRKDLLISAVEKINLLVTVAESIDVGILVCDEENHLVMVNKCAQRLLPMSYSYGIEIWSAIKDEKIVDFFREILLNREKVINYETDVSHKGRHRLLSVNAVPLVQDGKITGTLIYIEDITERRKAEARLRRAENLASLTTLAAGVAHEIKNPLGSISIHLQLLQKAIAKTNAPAENSLEKSTEKYFNVLKEEVDRLNRIVVDFLFAVRPVPLELRMEDINKIISGLMEFVEEEMKWSDIKCNLELEENLPKILIDERYMKQALLNLMKNSQSAMPIGGELTISTSVADNEINIKVMDTGIGIKKENIAKIFEPYFTTKETGTGLGLTQVYKIIREHQGEITVTSKPRQGTCFEIILPVPQKETLLIPCMDSGVLQDKTPLVTEGDSQ